jgi:hypothetical protein
VIAFIWDDPASARKGYTLLGEIRGIVKYAVLTDFDSVEAGVTAARQRFS